MLWATETQQYTTNTKKDTYVKRKEQQDVTDNKTKHARGSPDTQSNGTTHERTQCVSTTLTVSCFRNNALQLPLHRTHAENKQTKIHLGFMNMNIEPHK